MTVRDIVPLGDPRLYLRCDEVRPEELADLEPCIRDLHDTMLDFQSRHGWGRAISAPQIGVQKRIVCMHIDDPLTFVNPVLDEHSGQKAVYWEDCMSFPELLVQLENSISCRLTYRDQNWQEHRVRLTRDMAELLQHEVDHLDGVLSIHRALGPQSIALRRARPVKPTQLEGEFARLT